MSTASVWKGNVDICARLGHSLVADDNQRSELDNRGRKETLTELVMILFHFIFYYGDQKLLDFIKMVNNLQDSHNQEKC